MLVASHERIAAAIEQNNRVNRFLSEREVMRRRQGKYENK
jgi:hypothetical protein